MVLHACPHQAVRAHAGLSLGRPGAQWPILGDESFFFAYISFRTLCEIDLNSATFLGLIVHPNFVEKIAKFSFPSIGRPGSGGAWPRPTGRVASARLTVRMTSADRAHGLALGPADSAYGLGQPCVHGFG